MSSMESRLPKYRLLRSIAELGAACLRELPRERVGHLLCERLELEDEREVEEHHEACSLKQQERLHWQRVMTPTRSSALGLLICRGGALSRQLGLAEP